MIVHRINNYFVYFQDEQKKEGLLLYDQTEGVNYSLMKVAISGSTGSLIFIRISYFLDALL